MRAQAQGLSRKSVTQQTKNDDKGNMKVLAGSKIVEKGLKNDLNEEMVNSSLHFHTVNVQNWPFMYCLR